MPESNKIFTRRTSAASSAAAAAAAAGRNSSVSVPLPRNPSTGAASLVRVSKTYTNPYYNENTAERDAYRNPENWTIVKLDTDDQPKLYAYQSPLNPNITAVVNKGLFRYIMNHSGGSRSRRTVRRKHKSHRKSNRVHHTRRKQTRRHRHRR